MFGRLSVRVLVSALCGMALLAVGSGAVSTTTANAAGPGYKLGDPGIVDRPTYTLRLLSNGQNVEALRSVAQTAANDVASASGVTITVAPGTIPYNPNVKPGDGEIFLAVTATGTECAPGLAAACTLEREYLPDECGKAIAKGGRIWVLSYVVSSYSAADRLHVVEHELGHVLGLSHYEEPFNGEYQVMHSSIYDASSYRSGDRKGLAVLAPQFPKATTPGSYVPPGAPAPMRLGCGQIDVFSRLQGVGDQLDFVRASSGARSVSNLTPSKVPKMGASPAVFQMKVGAMHAFAPNTDGDMVCYYRSAGEGWNYINLSSYAGANLKLDKTATPSVVEWAPNRVSVFARAVNGDLVSFEREAGGSWFFWNESAVTSGHPTIAGSPAAVLLNPPSAYANTDLVVFGRNSNNELMSFNRSTTGVWTPYNVTANTGTSILGNPSPVMLDPNIYAGSGLGVYARNTNNELIGFDRMMNGAWYVYNVTKNIPGAPQILDSPAPVRLDPGLYAGSVLGVYARASNNDLVGFDRKSNGAWYVYNVSATNGYPKISSPPSVLGVDPAYYAGSGLQIHARNTNNELLSFDRFMNGGWLFYNETANVSGNPKVE